MEEEIKADMNVDFVGPYQPTPFPSMAKRKT